MKRIIYTLAILLIAFTVNAQSNRSRSERTKKSESTKKEQVQRPARTSTPANRSNRNVQRSSDKPKSGPAVNKKNRGNSGNNRSTVKNNNSKRSQANPDRGNRSSQPRTSERQNYQRREAERPRVENRSSGRDQNISRERNEPAREAYRPRTGNRYESERRSYSSSHSRRIARPAPKTYHAYKPIEYRRVHYHYRVPPRRAIIWNVHMYHEYVRLYPDYHLWYYPMGYSIHTISAYDAGKYIGEIARVYGEVYNVWYTIETDEYLLYIGGPYPYQDFTIILEGRDARRFNRHPDRYFTGRHVAATGLVSVYEGKPEMLLKRRSQLDVY